MLKLRFCRSLVCFVFLAVPAYGQDPPAAAATEPVVMGEMRTIESEVIGETYTLRISTPPGYEEGDERHGVVYMVDAHYLFLQGAVSVRNLDASGFPSLILVGIDTVQRNRDLTPAPAEDARIDFPEAGGSEAFQRFLVEELQPFIDATYRTNGVRILAGHSFGGLFVLDTLIKRPEAFQGFLVLSPSLWFNGKAHLDQLRSAPPQHPMFGRFVFFAIGDEGPRMNGPFEELLKILGEKSPLPSRWTARHFPGDNHWEMALTSLRAGLRQYAAPFTEVAEGILTVEELDERYQALDRLYGIEMPRTPFSFVSLARGLEERGETEAALDIYAVASERFPEDPLIYRIRGQKLEEASRLEDAAALYDRAIEKFKDSPEGERLLETFRARRQALQARLEEGDQ
ncbi:MAG TPA: alpha/beta hydrolase-fold protein [Acidobacteriota bacterium]|nr:alpha/beta hydrolase-fold protein [Acidobacteriota bacterium]